MAASSLTREIRCDIAHPRYGFASEQYRPFGAWRKTVKRSYSAWRFCSEERPWKQDPKVQPSLTI
jgi:hypothetical protein